MDLVDIYPLELMVSLEEQEVLGHQLSMRLPLDFDSMTLQKQLPELYKKSEYQLPVPLDFPLPMERH